MNKHSLRSIALLTGCSVAIALATYTIISWFAQLYLRAVTSYYGPSVFYSSSYQPPEIAALDAILLILAGALLLLGSGGISLNSASAAFRASVASALGKETVGPSEMMRRDAWRPRGYIRVGLILITAGIFSIILTFVLILV